MLPLNTLMQLKLLSFMAFQLSLFI